MILWIVFAVIALAVSAFMLLPLLRRDTQSATAAEYDIQVYRSQLAEVESSTASGQLSEAEAAAARTEISRRILAADRRLGSPPDAAPQAARSKTGQRLLAGCLGLAVPVASVLIYFQLGSPELPGHPFADRGAHAGASSMQAAGEMSSLVEQLAARLQQQPDDVEGWRLLGRSLMQLDRLAEAAEALGNAVRFAPRDAELQASYGEALTLASRGIVPPGAVTAFEASLRADPGNPRARYYQGLASAQSGEQETALRQWLALAADSPADAPWRELLEGRIREVRVELGLEPTEEIPMAAGSLTPQQPAQAARPGTGTQARPMAGPSAEDIEAAQDMSEEDRQAMIESMVERLAGRLEENPNDLAGWLMLARSNNTLGRPEGERDALAKAAELDPENPEILAMYGRAIRIAAGNRQTDESLAVMRRLLKVDETNMQALWFVAMGEARAGRRTEARALFDKALARIPADSPERAEMESRIEVMLAN